MVASLESVSQQVADLSQNIIDSKEATDIILAEFAEKGRMPEAEAAIIQLEKNYAELKANTELQLAKIKRTSWDRGGNYRGVFDNEDQARAFGLYCMSTATGINSECDAFAKRCAEVLKTEYPDVQKSIDTLRAMDSTTDGSLIAPEWSSRIHRLVESFGVFERNAFFMPMSSNTLSFTRETGGMTVFEVGENAAGSESDPSYANIHLNAKELGTLTFVPRSLSEDSAAEIGEMIAINIAQAFAASSDDVGFNGDGSATYFGLVGIRKRLQNINGVDDGGGIILGAGNLWSEYTDANFLKMMGSVPEYGGAFNPEHYCHRIFFFTVMVPIIEGGGGVTAGEVEGRRRLLFRGDPVNITQKMPKTDANSQIANLYGDLRLAATVGRRRDLLIESSREYKFAERQVTYLGTRRYAMNVHSLGTSTDAGPVVGIMSASS